MLDLLKGNKMIILKLIKYLRIGLLVFLLFLMFIGCDKSSTEPDDSNNTLELSTSSLDFGTDQTQLYFWISNPGIEVITWIITDNKDWITISPDSGSTTTEIDQITVTIDRSDLQPEDYAENIAVKPNIGDPLVITVSMRVLEELISDYVGVSLINNDFSISYFKESGNYHSSTDVEYDIYNGRPVPRSYDILTTISNTGNTYSIKIYDIIRTPPYYVIITGYKVLITATVNGKEISGTVTYP